MHLLVLTFVYHHHFILGMGTMVMWPSHAASRCCSLKQQPSWWEKRFISVHGPSLMSAWSHRKHRLGVSRQIQYWLQLPRSVRIIYSPSAVKLSNHWPRICDGIFLRERKFHVKKILGSQLLQLKHIHQINTNTFSASLPQPGHFVTCVPIYPSV